MALNFNNRFIKSNRTIAREKNVDCDINSFEKFTIAPELSQCRESLGTDWSKIMSATCPLSLASFSIP